MSIRSALSSFILTAAFLPGLAGAPSGSFAADRTQLGRDASRNAVSPERGGPIDWDIETGRNVRWSARLGTLSHCDPVIADGLVWIGTNSAPDEPDAAVLACFRERDGQLLYRYRSPRLEVGRVQDWPGASLASSPLIEGDRLWFCTNRCETVCLDIGPLRRGEGDPRVVWKVDMRDKLRVVPRGVMMGTNAIHGSVAGYRDLIYVNTTNSRREDVSIVESPKAPSLICLRKTTGEIVWQDASPGEHILDVQFGSPTVCEVAGKAQVVMGQGDGWLRSFDCLSGKLLWKFDINLKEHSTKSIHRNEHRNYFVASPVFHGNRIFIASGRHWEAGGGLGRLCSIDATKSGDVSSELEDGPGRAKPNPNSALVWEFAARGNAFANTMHDSVSNVTIHDGLVITPNTNGLVHCLDSETGRKYWSYDALGTIVSSPVVVDGKVYIGTDHAELVILALARELRVIATLDMSDSVYASPVFANGVLYVPTRNRLHAIGAPAQ